MGLMRFAVTPPERISEDTVQQAYMSGIDRIAWQCRVRYSNGELALERSVSESGNLHIPWLVEGHGQVTLSTGSLMERQEPYHLPVELARGEIGQIRNQLSEWQLIGLPVPEEINNKLAEARGYFARAVAGPQGSEQSAQLAEEAIRGALEASNRLADCYAEQALTIRHRTSSKLPTLLGADLGISLLDNYTSREFLQTFNAATVPMVWREVETSEGNRNWSICDKQIEWCRSHGLTVCGGPLLQLDRWSVPDWLYVCEGDFDSLLSFATEFITAAVNRYKGRVDLWQCIGRLSAVEFLSLTEEEKVRLAAQTIELTRSLDPQTPVATSFDQPWAEYMSRQNLDFPPLHLADALVRADLGLTAVVLEMDMGYHPEGTLNRDPLELSRQLDYWSGLGLPIYLSLCVPSSNHPDPLARRRAKPPAAECSPRTQRNWIARYLPLILAKPYVYGVYWNQLRDSEPHDFSHGGLFDLRRHPKPAIHVLASIRKAHLK